MNRCSSSSTSVRVRALALALATGIFCLIPPLVIAQKVDPQRIPPMATNAQSGVLHVTQPPEVLLNGQPARLAPGARIRDRNNLLVVSGALIGQDLLVRYTRDSLGLIHEVWVLTAAEAAAGLPPVPQIPSY